MVAPDKGCVTTPDGGCVGTGCMHDQKSSQDHGLAVLAVAMFVGLLAVIGFAVAMGMSVVLR